MMAETSDIPFVYPTWGHKATRAFDDLEYASKVAPRKGFPPHFEDMPGVHYRCPLTVRELEVIAAIAEGGGRNAVSKKLGISPLTVATHLSHAKAKLVNQVDPEKLNIKENSGLVFYCCYKGWIETSTPKQPPGGSRTLGPEDTIGN